MRKNIKEIPNQRLKDFDEMISDIVRLILEEKDCSRKYYYHNLCLKWDNGIVVSAREDESYMVNKYDIINSIDHIAEQIERDYVIVLVFNFY